MRGILEPGRKVTVSVYLLLYLLLVVPVAGVAQETAALSELTPFLSLTETRGEDSPARDAGLSPPPRDGAGRRGFTVEEVIGPIPLTSSVTEEPTYEQRADGSFNTYIKFKGILVVESGLTPFHAHRMADSRGRRREWPHERRGWRPHVADSVRPGQPEVLGDAGGGACIRVPYRVAHGDGTGQVSARASARLRERRGPGWQFVFLLQRYFPFA
jgi:hypothetical protein